MDTSKAGCSQSNSIDSTKKAQEKAIQIMRDSGRDIVEPGRFAAKHALAAPYYLFFTRVEESEETYNQRFSITFPEILDTSLGKITNSLHLTSVLDADWLSFQYVLAGQNSNITVLCTERIDDEKVDDNITAIEMDRSEFGSHHTKMMILQYEDNGIRVVVSTADLYLNDWKNRTQGLWISPHLPPLPKSAKPSDGDSPTSFKKDLVQYLNGYFENTVFAHNSGLLRQWIKIVEKVDFTAVNVCLVASIPGNYATFFADHWGHNKLSYLLFRHVTLPSNASWWSIAAQTSTMGSYGTFYEYWLSKEMIASMSKTRENFQRLPKFQLIYPSVENYEQSFDFLDGTCGFSYSSELHSKQEWIESLLYQWKATKIKRDRAMPRIKSYTRISPDLKSIAWFMLTSANLTKSAWGVWRKPFFYISNYEAGVLFLPKFITNTRTFPIEDKVNPNVPTFPIPYDLPLQPYDLNDEPVISRELF